MIFVYAGGIWFSGIWAGHGAAHSVTCITAWFTPSADLHLAAVLLLFPLLPTSYSKGNSPRVSYTMLPFIQGRLRLVALLAFKNPTSTIVYLKSVGWSNAALSPTLTPHPTPYAPQEPLYVRHSLPSRVKSLLGDAADPRGGLTGFAMRVPPHFVCQKEKWAGLPGPALRPEKPFLLDPRACPSPVAEEGRPASLDVSAFWCMKVKESLVVSSQQEHLSCPL